MVYTGGDVHSPYCQQIEDARAISGRSVRMTELLRLSGAPGLSKHQQEHLIDALLEGGFFEENAEGLVLFLNRNQVAPETVERIRREIRTNAPSEYKTRVLEALAREPK